MIEQWQIDQRGAGVQVIEERDGKPELIIGHAAVFYSESDPGTEFQLGRNTRERIEPGAFDGAMKRGDDVRALRDHDPRLLLGRTSNGTLRLSVDQRGLAFEIEPDNTTVGSDTRKMIRRGDLTGASFGFVVSKESFSEDGDDVIRHVEDIEPLIDVSPVTFPAFAAADSSLVRRSQNFSNRLVDFIAAHRDEAIGTKLETRAAKMGIVVPKAYNPESIHRARARQLWLKEQGLQ